MNIEEALALALCEAWGNNPTDRVRPGAGLGTYLERERRVVAKVLPLLKARGFDLSAFHTPPKDNPNE